MKTIFPKERKAIGTWEPHEIQEYVDGWKRRQVTVLRREHPIVGHAQAHFAADHGVLLVECGLADHSHFEWTTPELESRRILVDMTWKGEAAAIRKAIELIDAYYAEVAAAIPPKDTRPDKEIIAEAQAQERAPDKTETLHALLVTNGAD